MVDTVIVENEPAPSSPVSWSAIFAGAVVSAGLSLILLALGSGIGFSVINPFSSAATATTTKAATVAGIYMLVTAVIASAVGGYLAGRLRHLWLGTHPHEAFFRDTAHGLVSWAVATIASAILLGSVTANLTGTAALAARDHVMVSKTDGNQPNTQSSSGVARADNLDPAAVEQARRVSMMLSFWLAASLLAGALAASLAAWDGGAIRDGRMRY